VAGVSTAQLPVLTFVFFYSKIISLTSLKKEAQQQALHSLFSLSSEKSFDKSWAKSAFVAVQVTV